MAFHHLGKMSKNILVTGGNSGIGLALCKLLIKDHSCYVYLGSRDAKRGADAMKKILEEVPDKSDKIEVIKIDVGDDNSCAEAAKTLKAKGIKLYALVNNAGIMSAEAEVIMNTNFKGPKRVTDALIGLIDETEGRIVNTSSGAASMWLRHQDATTKTIFTNPDVTFEDLETAVNENVAAKNFKMGNGYGLSKAGLCALTLIQAKSYPNLKVTSLSPGFIDTPMTKGFGAKLTPEQGCLSSIKCLFEPVTSGYYYGSDGLRSPLTVTRDPGMPEYEGEENPDASKYNK